MVSLTILVMNLTHPMYIYQYPIAYTNADTMMTCVICTAEGISTQVNITKETSLTQTDKSQAKAEFQMTNFTEDHDQPA